MLKGGIILKHKRRKANAIYSDGILTNRYKNEYQKLVKNTNAKRSRMIDKYYNEIKNTPNMVGISKDAFAKQLEDKGFISKKLSTSLKGFNSLAEVKNEIKDLKTINKPYYFENNISKLRNRMIRQIHRNTGKQGSEIANMIKNLSNAQLVNLYNNASEDLLDEIFESDSVGDTEEERASALSGRLNIVGRNLLTKQQRNKYEKGKANGEFKNITDFFQTKQVVKTPKKKK